MEINVEQPDKAKLEKLGVENWPIWEKEVSEFPWHYDDKETCYLLKGRVVVIPHGGEPVEIKAGDLVEFPKGMDCTWNIIEDVRKHFALGEI